MKTKYLKNLAGAIILATLASCGGIGSCPSISPVGNSTLTITSSGNPSAGGSCRVVTATVSSAVSEDTVIHFTVTPTSTAYGFGTQGAATYPDSTTCTILSGQSSCSTSIDTANNLCAAASATTGTTLTVSGAATGYTAGTLSTISIMAITNFVAGDGSGNVYLSANGELWSSAINIAGTNAVTTIAYGNGYFVAGDSAGKIYISSDDGVTWTQATTANNPISSSPLLYNGVHSITYGNYNGNTPTFIASDGGGCDLDISTFECSQQGGFVYTSTNGGANWILANGGGAVTTPPDYGWLAIAFGNNIFAGVDSVQTVFYSTTGGTSWTQWTSETVLFGGGNPIITFGNGYFMAASGSNNVRTSTNGENWNPEVQASGSGAITAIGYGNGKFLVNDTPNGMSISTDNGVTWAGPASGNLGQINSIVYGGTSGSELYLAGGSDGKVYRSANGSGFTNFTQVATGSINTIASKYIAPSRKMIFVTTALTSGGDLITAANSSPVSANPPVTDGFAGGDAICQYYAGVNGYSGTYKALIAGTNRIPGGSDWVIQASTPYVRASDTSVAIATSTESAILPSPLTNPIVASSNPIVTGFLINANPWAVDTTKNCQNWTSASGTDYGSYGDAGMMATNAYPGAGFMSQGYLSTSGSNICSNTATQLYCVQQ